MSRRLLGALLAPAALLTSFALAPMAVADPGGGGSTKGAAAVHDGLSAQTAAASCWDIKTQNPAAADGAYWLQTPTMDAPGQYYCDQTTDGGGWVLIGRGREGWEPWTQGKGDRNSLTARGRTAADMAVAQLSTKEVNQLIGNGSVSGLEDGVRVLRSLDPQGSSFQALDLSFPQMTDFVWFFKMGHPVNATFNHGPVVSSRAYSRFGYDDAWNANNTYPSWANGFTIGFGFGPGAQNYPGDTASAGSFFRKIRQTVFPYSEVYLRPRIASDSSDFTRIPDEGAAASTVTRAVSEFAAPTQWGVTGNLNGSYAEGNIQVQTFEQVGTTMFVGGNFTGVRSGADGAITESRGLAAFDVNTGAFTGMAFNFNNQVKDLLTLPSGKLLAVGDFTYVNGEEHVGTVVLDPATGQIDPDWNLTIMNAIGSHRVSVRTARFYNGQVYLGGTFTHLRLGDMAKVYARNAGRVGLDGRPDRSWNPEFNASVLASDINEQNGAYYAGGHFTRAHGDRAWYAARLSTDAGAAVDPSFDFKPSTVTAGKYQQTITSVGDRVYIGGAEHSLFSYDAATNQRLSASIMMSNGGDLQASAASPNGVIYASCHCSDAAYQDAEMWTIESNWTRADDMKWVGAWDTATGKNMHWTPFEISSQRKTGAWALTVDSNGNLWAGGDFTRTHTSVSRTQWNGGFARFDARDTTPPEAPAQVRAAASTEATVTLSWTPVADADAYEILRDDRTVAQVKEPTVELARAGENRFFVRAVDAEGNRSATSPVYVPPAFGEHDPSDPVLVDDGATWSYRYEESAADEAWASPGYDDSAWPRGAAPLGRGDDRIATDIQTAPHKTWPITSYFRTHFTVADPSAVSGVNVDFVADDGAIAYVNGAEVGRQRLGTGGVSYETRADAAPTYDAAQADRTTVFVPAERLVAGDNVLAVETHVNYRKAKSVSMQARVERVERKPGGSDSSPTPSPSPGATSSPVVNATGVTDGEIISSGTQWSYWTSQSEPTPYWASPSGDISDWSSGASPIGWGDPDAGTPLSIEKGDRAITNYFAADVDLGPITGDAKITLNVRADDGAVIYVNGFQLATVRMSEGAITHSTFANQAVSAKSAASNMVTVEVPAWRLVNGINRIGVEEHVNYRGTPSMTFDLTASLKRW